MAELGCDAEIYTLYVFPFAQRQGAGRLLMRALAYRLAEGGIRQCGRSKRILGVCFCERLGVRRIAQKTIEIGGIFLSEIAFAWDDLSEIA